MNVFKYIRAHVMADSAITARIGTRFYPLKVSQVAPYPQMTMQRISGVSHSLLRGRATLDQPRYQFDVWTRVKDGESAFDEGQTIGRLLKARLEGKNISVADDDGSPSDVLLMSFQFIGDQDLFEPDVNGGYYRYTADYYIWHQTRQG